MISTMELYHVAAADHTSFVRLTEDVVWPQLEKSNVYAIGLWRVVLGGADRLLQMTRYESVGHWLEAREGFDPRADIIRDASTSILRPVTQRQPESTAPESEPGIYTLRTFRIDPGNLARFIDLSENQWWPWVGQGEGVRPICQWKTVIGEDDRVYMMSRYDDLSHWAGHQAGNERKTLANPELKEIYERALNAIVERQKITRETSVKILEPLSQRLP